MTNMWSVLKQAIGKNDMLGYFHSISVVLIQWMYLSSSIFGRCQITNVECISNKKKNLLCSQESPLGFPQ